MSIKIMNLVWQNAPYSEGTLLVLLALADWADDDGFCWPKVANIASKARLSRSGAEFCLRNLRKDGAIKVVTPSEGRTSNAYQIDPQYLRALTNKDPQSTKGDPLSKPSRNKEEPSYEPSVERENGDIEQEVYKVAGIHPRLKHRRQGTLSRAEMEAIAEAIIRDGSDLVIAGSRNLADAVASWPKDELRFIPEPVKFYRTQEYLQDPAIWQRGNSNGTDRQGTAKTREDLTGQADPECRKCYGGGYAQEGGESVPCGCTRRAVAAGTDRRPRGNSALGDAGIAPARTAQPKEISSGEMGRTAHSKGKAAVV